MRLSEAYKVGFYDGLLYGSFDVDLDLMTEEQEADYRQGYDNGVTYYCNTTEEKQND